MNASPKVNDRVVDFLFEKDAIRFGESPWEGAIGDNDAASFLNFGELFPTGRNVSDGWPQQLPGPLCQYE